MDTTSACKTELHLTDTHTHLYLEEFDSDRDGAVRRAIEAGVTRMIFPNVDLSTIVPMETLAARFPDNIRVAMGLHPTEVNDASDDALAEITERIRMRAADYVAVGEIGMDLYWDRSFESKQMDVLERQLALSVELGKPVIIHCREALDQTLEVMSGFGDRLCGVFHSFGGTADDVERICRDYDFYFGINGIVTFKNSGLRKTLPAIEPARLLLETDSPYLAPVPMRGKRNESAYIVHTAQVVARELGLTMPGLAEMTSDNASRLFGWTFRDS